MRATGWDNSDVDAGWFAVIGAAVGAAATAIGTLGKSIVDGLFQRSDAKAQRKHELLVAERARRHEQIEEWREGLAGAHAECDQWIREFKRKPPEYRLGGPDKPPNIVSAPWFQSLRPYLTETGEAGEYRDASELHCSTEVMRLLRDELARIEREWRDEAMG